MNLWATLGVQISPVYVLRLLSVWNTSFRTAVIWRNICHAVPTPCHIITGCHSRQLWGMFLHAGNQLPFLHYNCTGWMQHSAEQRDLKGPEWGNSTTPSATKDRREEWWLAFGRRACISCVGPDGSVIKFCSGLRYYWDFCSRHSILWYLCYFHWVGLLCQNLAWETFKLFWGKNSQRCSGFVFKFKVAFKQG